MKLIARSQADIDKLFEVDAHLPDPKSYHKRGALYERIVPVERQWPSGKFNTDLYDFKSVDYRKEVYKPTFFVKREEDGTETRYYFWFKISG